MSTCRQVSPPNPGVGFATTRWSVVLAARDGGDPPAAQALDALCRAYWYPLYAFVRRQGRSPADAEDLTQAFFARLLEKNYLAAVDDQKGRFRSFLIVALKRFLADEWDRAHAQKRGGGQSPIPLDLGEAEDRYRLEPQHDLSPERLFERRWAISLLGRARGRLQQEYALAGKSELFEQLKGFHHPQETTLAYAEVAATLRLPQNTVKSHVHRLRQRFRQLVREEIEQTVATPEEVDDEIRHLLAVVAE